MNGWLRVVSVVLVLGWSVSALAASDYEDGVRELTKAIVAEAGKLNKQNLAVVDFTDLQGNVTALGRFLAEELSGSLVMAGGIQVVDRNQLNKIFQEHSLSMLGISDPEAVKKVGKVAGADALITGSITEMADSVRVTAKVMATDTARVIAAAKTTIPKTGTIADLVKRGIEAPGAKPSAAKTDEASSSPLAATQVKLPTYEGQSWRMMVSSVAKSGDTITLICFLESTGKKPYLLELAMSDGEMYLLDDLGQRWELARDQVGGMRVEIFALWFTGKVELIPGTKIKISLAFRTGGETEGKTFTLIAAEGMGGSGGAGSPAMFGKGRRVVIKGLQVQKQGPS